MQNAIAIVIVAAAIAVIALAARAAGKRGLRLARPGAARDAAQGQPDAAAPEQAEEELLAVIAAAVAAASGMAADSFWIVGLQPSVAQRGFNTPVWGHVDRFNRGERI